MKNADSLKARIKNLAKEKRVSSRILLQNYMFERFLERISHSPHRDHFVIKGGVLVAAMVGISSRSTMDIDVAMRSYPLDEEHVRTAVDAICSVDLDDNVRFTLEGIQPIRPDDEYGGFRITLRAFFDTIRVPITLDVTSGDVITPGAVRYTLRSIFSENGVIQVWAYNIETILAEKTETILRRGVFNSRMRDFYDVYVLTKTQSYDARIFREALRRTAEHRGTIEQIKDTSAILDSIDNSEELAKYWRNYQREYDYARDISFSEIFSALQELLQPLSSAFEELELE